MEYTIYYDHTGKFPVTSIRGQKYLIIMCEVDSNTILEEPIKNKNENLIICTYQTLLNRLRGCGIKTERHVLDNDIPDLYKEKIKGNGIKYELVP